MKEKDLNKDFLDVDPLRDTYREGVTSLPAIRKSLEKHHPALLVIDLQYLDAAQGYGVFAEAERSGVPIEAQEYYFYRLKEIVYPMCVYCRMPSGPTNWRSSTRVSSH